MCGGTARHGSANRAPSTPRDPCAHGQVIRNHAIAVKSLEQFQDTYDAIVGASNRALTAADLQLMVRWGRLIHTVRLPLLFTKLRDDLFVLAGNSYICTVNPAAVRPTPLAAAGPTAAAPAPVPAGAAEAANVSSGPTGGRARAPTGPSSRDTASPPPQAAPTTEAVTLAWYRELLATFVRDYVAYLNSIELSLVFTDTAELGSTFVISETVFVPTPRVFLMHVRGGRAERRGTDPFTPLMPGLDVMRTLPGCRRNSTLASCSSS